MNAKKLILPLVTLLLMGGAALVVGSMQKNQRLGAPGIKTEPIPGSRNLHVLLPENVLHYKSIELRPEPMVTNVLPADTSFGTRVYLAGPNSNDWINVNVVLMGSDRTSIHKPEFCLQGQGWQIDHAASSETTIAINQPHPYDLPVVKFVSSQTYQDANGNSTTRRSIYVYWFVADDALSGDASGRERMWWMAKHLLRTGELQRWAYISCFAVCVPGQEDATFERMKKFISASVPEFQLTPKAGEPARAKL